VQGAVTPEQEADLLQCPGEDSPVVPVGDAARASTGCMSTDRITVDPARMAENLESSHGLCFSQPVLLALVASGMTRDDAYRVVQRNAHAAWEQRKPFRSLLEADPEMTAPAEALDRAFSLERALAHAGRAVDALSGIEDLPDTASRA